MRNPTRKYPRVAEKKGRHDTRNMAELYIAKGATTASSCALEGDYFQPHQKGWFPEACGKRNT